MRAIVTGGCGFIGAHLVRRLLADGHQVVVIDDLSGGLLSRIPIGAPHLTFRQQSILGDLDFSMADVVFHLAALPRVQRSLAEPLLTHTVNVEGTLAVLLEARRAEVRRVVFSSSSSVYGDQDRLPFVETMTPQPKSPYGLHKREGELYCQLFSRLWPLETICLRYFNVYGPGMSWDSPYANLIPRFTQAFINGQSPVINGDGEQTRDFCYVDDVVEANLRAARLGEPRGHVFNIGTGRSYSVNQVTARLQELLNVGLFATHGPAVVEPQATRADPTKARLLLGWQAQTQLPQGLALTLQGDGLLEKAV
jgi:UDP-glucose 4-epimerase